MSPINILLPGRTLPFLYLIQRHKTPPKPAWLTLSHASSSGTPLASPFLKAYRSRAEWGTGNPSGPEISPTPTLPSLGLGLTGDSQHIWLYLNHPAPNCSGMFPAFLPSALASPTHRFQTLNQRKPKENKSIEMLRNKGKLHGLGFKSR